ncbi:chemotaxis protein CheW [Vibrio sp. S4M6]|uniref:chemotaxis protein CheW n=1 Tax=Vibrio sinus TaxID=2946865 RepID=UPI00202A5265|nr:chemotaxis protein CheW [Vibrio sinus]MCL9781827.1 chemotaxis protein CheW [Vibrio sinus]
MSNDSWLSSEQALDDYFSSLLDEETVVNIKERPVEAVTPAENYELKPQPIEESQSSFNEPDDDADVPNLQDVERLLEQLETENIVDKLNLEEILEQNTDQIAASKPQVDTIVETVVDEQVKEEKQLESEASDSAIEQTLEALQVDITEDDVVAVEEVVVETVDVELETEVVSEPQTQAGDGTEQEWHNTVRSEDFQVLYFEVNAITFAVPLDELGGIHKMGELNHLIGRPEWYLGLLTNNENQLDVVDTARWVMAEKLHDESYKDNYQYIVMLGSSLWGLASTQLKGTEILNSDKVRWREQAGKRPWLAGMVKEKMCALIHVEALIAMLNAGLDVKALEE